jgi:hypothetical protein
MRQHKDRDQMTDILLESKPFKKLEKKNERFNIEGIFDSTFKPGQPVKVAKKERKTGKDKLVMSRQMDKDVINTTYKKYHAI